MIQKISSRYSTPIALFSFNRPHLSAQVLQRISSIKPTKLFLVTNGPRKGHSQDIPLCQKVHKVISNIDWDCDVHTNFSDTNIGCRKRISSGIDWVFEHVEEAIILEDDCLPEISFFQFCSEMLKYHKNEPRIMMISGNNFLPQKEWKENSYFYSHIGFIWGWATWRRAWQEHFDVNIKDWPMLKYDRSFRKAFGSRRKYRHYKRAFDMICNGLDTWDYQWNYAMRKNKSLCVCPRVNLVANIGFGKDSTNTCGDPKQSYVQTQNICFPLKHKNNLRINLKKERYLFCHHQDLRGTSFKVWLIDMKLNLAECLPVGLKNVIKMILRNFKRISFH